MRGRLAAPIALATAWAGFIATTLPFNVSGKPEAIAQTIADHPTGARVWGVGSTFAAVAFVVAGIAIALGVGARGRRFTIVGASLVAVGGLGKMAVAVATIVGSGMVRSGSSQAQLAATINATPEVLPLAGLEALGTIIGIALILAGLHRSGRLPRWLPISYPVVAIVGTALLPWVVTVAILSVAIVLAARALAADEPDVSRHRSSGTVAQQTSPAST